jgi:glutathione S-transferase
MLTLYHFPTSTCSQKVRLALAEKELSWRSQIVEITQNEQLSDWYLKLNPNGVVPTLAHDDHLIRDSSVINEYLEDVFPDRPLRPADPVQCARVREWRQFVDEIATAAVRYPSVNAMMKKGPTVLTDTDERRRKDADARRSVRRHLHRKIGPRGFSDEEVDVALEQLRMTVLRMDESLISSPWLAGEQFTLADVSMTPSIVRMEDLGLDRLWADLPRIADWYERAKSRRSFGIAFFPGARHDYKSMGLVA